MKQREKAHFEAFCKNVLNSLRAAVPKLIAEYIVDNECVVNSFKLQKLRQKFEECDGNGNLLLSEAGLCRVKMFENGFFNRPVFIVPISGAEEFLAVFDCRTRCVHIEETPLIVPQPF